MSTVVTVTGETLEQDVLHSSTPVLLDLWAPWCAPCRSLAPNLEKLAVLATGALKVAKLDVEQYPEAMANFNVRGIPTLLLFKDGKEVSREIGVKTLDQLMKWMTGNGIVLERPPVVRADTPRYPAFYGDPELKEFLFFRLEQQAAKGLVQGSRDPFWLDGKGTPAAAMAHNADIDVFERLSGMPAAVGHALDFVQASSPETIRSLSQALTVGTDLSRVPALVLYEYLKEPTFDWPGLLAVAPDADALRCAWLKQGKSHLQGEAVDEAAIAEIKRRAESLQQHPDRAIQRLAKLLLELSPIPACTQHDQWAAVFRVAGNLSFSVGQHQCGWTAEDRDMERRRHQWFSEREALTATGKLSPEELTALRAQWLAENGEYQAKEAAFIANNIQGLQGVQVATRAYLIAAFKSAPLLLRV
ncbi:thioredoxin family protein [Pseudomonas rhizoryzae]|uniref:thioredoxin family protein n=1 Tax=Pseudomonas rhizoryzae TaxID=2571129 RepID=UPI0009BF8CC4|nr:thioredoxin domain-containing protein [Pseudomonas rhizoryzae]